MTQRKQSNNPAIDRLVVARETSTRRLAVNFPGWDSPDYERFLLEIPTGLTGRITNVEHHGSNPWTRYGVRFSDGTTAHGLILGKDIRIMSFDEAEAAGLDGTLRTV